MKMGATVIVLALAVVFAIPSRANDRPHDPFGNHTIELTSEAPLFAVWRFLRDQVVLDKTKILSCMGQHKSSCPEVATLMKIVEEAQNNQGKALLGHLNRSINLMIKAAPGEWTGPLDALRMKNGDCKSYSIAKYGAVRAAGFAADHVRSVIVHIRRSHEDHMVTAVYHDDKWLILDNLTNLLVEDLELGHYEPLAVLDYKGVRRYVSAFSFD
jgi:predicted transglutaminase-like cysteine proteinase